MHFCTNEDMEMLKWINDFKRVSIFNHRVSSLLSSKRLKLMKKKETKNKRNKKEKMVEYNIRGMLISVSRII